MRLIDADKLNEEWQYTIRFGTNLTEIENLQWIVNGQDEIEAIPIEWIERYNHDDDRKYKSIRIKAMIDVWRERYNLYGKSR